MTSRPDILTRNEIAAWIQVALGGIGAICTILTTIPALKSITTASAIETTSTIGAVSLLQIFGVMLTLTVCLTLLSTGLGFLLGNLFAKISAPSPYYAAFCIVAATVLAAGGLTLAISRQPLWVWCALQSVLAIILAGQAQADRNKETFWMLAVILSIGVIAATWAVQSFAVQPPLVG